MTGTANANVPVIEITLLAPTFGYPWIMMQRFSILEVRYL